MTGRLVLLHQGAIGDFVLTLSAVQSVRAALSVVQAVRTALPSDQAQVTAVASTPAARLAAGRSVVDAWLSPEQVGLYTLFREDGPLDDRLAALLAEAQLVLSFLGDCSDRLHHRLQRAACGQVISVDPRPTAEVLTAGRHITSHWIETIRQQGINVPEATPAVIRFAERLCDKLFQNRARQEAAVHGRARPLPHGRGSDNDHPSHTPSETAGAPQPAPSGARSSTRLVRAVIHPGSGGAAKCWPVECFLALADALTGVAITWMLGSVELETDQDCVQLVRQRAAARREPVVIEPDLVEAARRLVDGDLYVGNDSGMTHVAAALGVPVVAVFGPTDPRVWRPLGSHVITVAPARPGDAAATVEVEAVRHAVAQLGRF